MKKIPNDYYLDKSYNRLTIIEIFYIEKERWAKCLCTCGSTHKARVASLTTNNIKSCGCLLSDGNKDRYQDLTDRKFDRLLVIAKSDNYPIKGVHWICQCDCGNLKIIAANSLTTGKTKSCGCLNQELKKQRSGKNHPKWNHDKSDEDRLDRRRYEEYYLWRRAVHERCDYKCQICQHNSSLVAHHIENYLTNISLRTDVNNGITLCSNCHNQFHKIYGNKENNQSQLDEFFKNHSKNIER